MKVFVHVVEQGSFTRASEMLGMSTGMVCHHVANLEKHSGVRLLNRTTRALSLTDEGRYYYDHCKRVLEEVDAAQTHLGNAHGTVRGRVRADLSSTMAIGLVVPILSRFVARYPEIKLELHHTGVFFGADYDGFDVMIRYGPFDDSDLVVKRLTKPLTVTVASPAYLAQHGEPQSPAELSAHSCLNFIDPKVGREMPWVFRRPDGTDFYQSVTGNLSFNEGKVRVEAAVRGLGIAQTSNYHVLEKLRDGRLKTILSDWASPNGPEIGILYSKRRAIPARVKAFVDFMVETYPPDGQFS